VLPGTESYDDAPDKVATTYDADLRGLTWQKTPSGWELMDRGDYWLVQERRWGWMVCCCPWFGEQKARWDVNGHWCWGSLEEALDAVADHIVAPSIGSGI